MYFVLFHSLSLSTKVIGISCYVNETSIGETVSFFSYFHFLSLLYAVCRR